MAQIVLRPELTLHIQEPDHPTDDKREVLRVVFLFNLTAVPMWRVHSRVPEIVGAVSTTKVPPAFLHPGGV